MAERRVAQVVPEGDGFGQFLVQPQDLGNRPRYLRHLEGVGQPRAVMVSGRREEHLRLVFQTAKGLAVNHPVAVTLERRADIVLLLGPQTSAGQGAFCRLWGQVFALAALELFSNGHAAISWRKLVPCASGSRANSSASVCPTSANVGLVPRSTPRRTRAPVTSSGTYSLEWSVLGVVDNTDGILHISRTRVVAFELDLNAPAPQSASRPATGNVP